MQFYLKLKDTWQHPPSVSSTEAGPRLGQLAFDCVWDEDGNSKHVVVIYE